MNPKHATLTKALGHSFKDESLLEQALTHRSAAYRNNERLEFLGDALINFVMAEAVYLARPQAEEGALSRLRASLVREESLAALAHALPLGDALKLGEGELRSGGWRRDSVLADAFEALIAAIFLDAGFAAAREVCLRQFAAMLSDLPDPESLKDPKTRLQEWLQGRGRPLPVYEVLSESGPPHRRSFVVRCSMEDAEGTSEATAASRRAAEQKAADTLLQILISGD